MPTEPNTRPLPSRIAYWLGAAAITIPLLGIGAIQVGLLAPMGGFYLYAVGLLAALAAGVVGLIGLIVSRGERSSGRGPATVGLALGLLLLGVTYLGASPGNGKPPINDITTDLSDPPSFAPANAVPDYANRDMSYPEGFAEQVRAGYPELSPLASDLASNDAYQQALQVAEDLGWEIVFRDPAGRTFDARESTAVFRFVDDITVRVRDTGEGSRIDLRSKSRDGRGDLGANAARIERFAEAFSPAAPVASR